MVITIASGKIKIVITFKFTKTYAREKNGEFHKDHCLPVYVYEVDLITFTEAGSK